MEYSLQIETPRTSTELHMDAYSKIRKDLETLRKELKDSNDSSYSRMVDLEWRVEKVRSIKVGKQ